jgi:TM2 domain-containing membrane protein YozV
MRLGAGTDPPGGEGRRRTLFPPPGIAAIFRFHRGENDMRGRLLAFDFRTGTGEISGDEGERYRFADSEWRAQGRPRLGQIVDFQSEGAQARSIYSLASPSALSGDKNRIVAALLAFFLGGLGIHKFYLGRNGAGLTMLLCSIFGVILLFIPSLVMGLIAFIEFIIYLVISDEDFEERYVQGDRAWF